MKVLNKAQPAARRKYRLLDCSSFENCQAAKVPQACKMPRDWDASEDTENDVPAYVIEAVDDAVKDCQTTNFWL